MSACTVQSLARLEPISLGLRVGVVGSEGFTSWVRGLVQMDSDVASLRVVESLVACASDSSLNLLIMEAAAIRSAIPNYAAEVLGGLSLIAVAGRAQEFLGDFNNVTSVEITDPDWWLRLKHQTVQRRLQEFTMLFNALADECHDARSQTGTLMMESGGDLSHVSVASVDWIRAAGNYVEIRANGRTHLMRSEMHSVQNRLTRSFLRIHRRVIINMQRLVRIEADSSTRLFAVLTTGERFAISRARRHIVRSRWQEMRSCES